MPECDSNMASSSNDLAAATDAAALAGTMTPAGDFSGHDDMPKYSVLMNLNRQLKLDNKMALAASDSYSPKRQAAAMMNMNGSFRGGDHHQQDMCNYAS